MALARLLDHLLKDVRKELLSMQSHVDALVSDALNTLKEPECNLCMDAERRDEEVNRLEKVIQKLVDEAFTRFHPVARDHRFLQAVMAIIQDLEHIGDCAKSTCAIAPSTGESLESLRQLSQLVQGMVNNCFRALQQFDLTDTGLTERIVEGRSASEEMCEQVQAELAEAGSTSLSPRQQQNQVLAAQDLKRISGYAASIADQLMFYNTGYRR